MTGTARILRPLLFAVAALVVALAFAPRTLLADDGPPADELRRRVEWLRQLPPEDRARLKTALQRFRDLPAEERAQLREKAARVGPERLEGLAGRDLKKLHAARTGLAAETDAVMDALGPGRLAGTTPAERAYLRAEAMRGFQRHLERRVLGLQTYDEIEKLTREEKRARIDGGLREIARDRLARLPDAERARIESLPPAEQRRAQRQLLAEFRLDESREYARVFDRFRVQPFLQLPAEKRAERVRKWQEQSRWTAVVRSVRDLGVGDEARRALASLGPADWARLGLEVAQTEALPPLERRARVERTIHRLAAERAADVPPLERRLRERRLLQIPRSPAADTQPAAPPAGR